MSDNCAYLSSDSDEDDFSFLTILLVQENIEEKLFAKMLRRESRYFRSRFFEDVIATYNESEFLQNLRICRELYDNLSEKLKSSQEYENILSPYACSDENALAVFLWFAGREDYTFEKLSTQFKLSEAAVNSIMDCVSRFLSNLTLSEIEWPTEDKKKESSLFFETVSFIMKGTIGCTRINRSESENFFNPKRRPCAYLQAVCNEKRKFISIFVANSESSSPDKWIFENSSVYPILKSICGGYRILGDSSYPCMECLLTPYKDRTLLTEAQQTYNEKLASCRNMSVEKTFRLLRQRFRQLNSCTLTNPKQMCNFVKACCVLHNLSRDEDFNFFETGKDNALVDGVETKIRDRVCHEMQLRCN